MYSRKSIAALLTGTSLSALSIASVPAFAETFSGPVPSLVISSPDDFIYLDDTFEAAGDVTVETNIGPGDRFIDGFLDPFIGMLVEDDASIGGTLIIENGATISAGTDNFGSGQRAATALRIEGEVPRIQNDGTIMAFVTIDGTEATATAVGVYHQFTGAGGVGSEALSQITNTGDITADAFASVNVTWTDNAYAEARALGISQQMSGAETTLAWLDNSGDINVAAVATAIGSDSASDADAYAYAIGVTQWAGTTGGAGSAATAQLTNSGQINVSASALASNNGTSSAYAQASALGVSQKASGAETALVSLINSGDIVVSATAKAIVGEDIYDLASARLYTYGLLQDASATGGPGSTATAQLTNSGNIQVSAFAVASQQGSYTAIAGMTSAVQGVSQSASGAETARVTLDNSGNIMVGASAIAIGGDYATSAIASAFADGVTQYAKGNNSVDSSAAVELSNSGSLTVTAFASASSQGTSYADASAAARGVYQQASEAETSVASLNNSGDIMVGASALALSGDGARSATASADATAVQQHASGNSDAGSSAMVLLTNSGSLTATAFASASHPGTDEPYASAIAQGVYQEARQAETSVALLDNSGDIMARATAIAIGGDSATSATASADATAVEQYAYGNSAAGSSATALLTNTGTIDAMVLASASSQGTAKASASVSAYGVYQVAQDAEDALATMTNSGDIAVAATADALRGDDGFYRAQASADAYAVSQYAAAIGGAGSSATVHLTNSGDITAMATATASQQGTYSALASATALAVYQQVDNAETAEASITNSGNLVVDANAYARGGDYATNATAYGYATGVFQRAYGDGSGTSAVAQLSNSGDIDVSAFASATSDGTDGVRAEANASGVLQQVENADTMLASLTNSGNIAVSARAFVGGSDENTASASASGLRQNFAGGTGTAFLDNSGMIGAFASASAFGDPQDAVAGATGYAVRGDDITLDVENSGSIRATASAVASNAATANATGVSLDVGGLTGRFANSGVIRASAWEFFGTATAVNAIGLHIEANTNGAIFENSGLIYAYAGGDGANASAQGVVFDQNGPPAVGGQAAFGNLGGTIWAGIGAENKRGTAINTQNAPNAVLISLQGNNPASYSGALNDTGGDGFVYGDIDVSDDDIISVNSGATWLDGLINPDSVNEGSIDISGDGNLVLMHRENGPSNVFIDDFTVQSDGTLSIELTADTTPGAYSSINATTASLDGAFVALYRPGLYADSQTYNDVIVSSGVPGTFAIVTDDSPLLETEAFYDGNTVDLNVTRTAFNAVAGLTRNQQSLSNAIESVYGAITPGSDFANLIGGLFLFDPAQYSAQLDSLTGSEYAQYLQHLLWSTSAIDRTLAERMGLASGFGGGGADALVAGSPAFGSGQVWGRISGGWHDHDGDDEASGYDGTQWSLMVGSDYALSNATFVGVAGALVKTDMNFDWSDNEIEYDGGQIALYGGYDDQSQYVRGIATAAFYAGDSTRRVVVAPGDPVSTLEGDPDATVFSISGEVGKRFEFGGNVVGTPFLGARYAHANLHGFTEDDPDGSGAALSVDDSSGDSFVTIVGARVAGEWAMGSGTIRPEASVAWMHEFGDSFQSIDLAFAGAPVGGDFNIISSETARDSALVSIGARYDISPGSQFTVKYDGTFNSDYGSHAFIGRYGRKF